MEEHIVFELLWAERGEHQPVDDRRAHDTDECLDLRYVREALRPAADPREYECHCGFDGSLSSQSNQLLNHTWSHCKITHLEVLLTPQRPPIRRWSIEVELPALIGSEGDLICDAVENLIGEMAAFDGVCSAGVDDVGFDGGDVVEARGVDWHGGLDISDHVAHDVWDVSGVK